MSGGIDNRIQLRAPIELRVDYKKMNTFFADYTKNLSKGGTFIKTRQPLAMGTTLVFRLGIPGFEAPVELNGEVTWILDAAAAAAQNTEPGMGIRFVFQADEQRLAFEAHVEQLMIESLGEDIYRQLLGRAS